MLTKIDEIWYYPFKDAEDVPEMVVRVLKAVRDITALYNTDITDVELLLKGIDPDMINEFCMFDESEWPELETYYEDDEGFCTMENAEMLGTKEYRARLIRDGIDPETEMPICYEEAPLTYEQWKASLTEGQREFPDSLVGTGQPFEFVDRLRCERDEFEEIATQMQEDLYL